MFNKMKRINNKKCCTKLNNLLLFVLVCVVIYGCSDLGTEDGPIVWSKSRAADKIIGFIDDSLVIVRDWREWHQELASFVWDGGEKSGIGHQGLRVYNYRVQEDGPRWTDTLDNENIENFTYLVGQLSDSIIWGGNGNNSFSFWKLGEKPVIKNVDVLMDDCSIKFRQLSMKKWLNNEIFLKGPLNASGDSCQYAILDTNAKTLTYKRLEEDLKWIEKCDDVRAWGESVYCLKVENENLNGFYLFVDSIKKDSIIALEVNNISNIWRSFEFGFMGSMVYFGHNINSLDLVNNKIMIYPNTKSTSVLNYINNDDIIVNYNF